MMGLVGLVGSGAALSLVIPDPAIGRTMTVTSVLLPDADKMSSSHRARARKMAKPSSAYSLRSKEDTLLLVH